VPHACGLVKPRRLSLARPRIFAYANIDIQRGERRSFRFRKLVHCIQLCREEIQGASVGRRESRANKEREAGEKVRVRWGTRKHRCRSVLRGGVPICQFEQKPKLHPQSIVRP